MSGKPLALLIPGLDGTGGLYYRQIESLLFRYRVHAWEFRRRSDFDFADLVQELSEGTDSDAPQSVTVVGESFGGAVAIHYVLAHPERVLRLVLINAFSYHPWKRRVRLGCRLAPLLRKPLFRHIKDFVVERTMALEGIELEDRRHYREVIARVHLPAYRRRLELVHGLDVRSRLQEICVQTYLFASGKDKIVPSVAQARFMGSRIPQAKVFEFPQAGHALLLTPGFFLADYF